MIILVLFVAALIGGGIWLWTPDKSRAALEAKYLNAPADMIEVSGVRLHVRDSGPKDAPAVILLHGFGSSLHTWEPWAQMLQVDYRVIRFDLPGSGLSAPDPTGDYTDARTMALLNALMNWLGVAQASLIGNSIGGRIAWRFAVRYPQRVTKLVLISPDGFASAGYAYRRKPNVPAMVKLMRYALPEALLRMNLAPAYGDPAALTDETVKRYYDLMRAPGSRDALIARMEQTVLEEPEPLLRRIRAPVLLIWGEKDALIPISNADDYLRSLPHATLTLLPGLGHVPQEEAPVLSFAPVRAFLAE
ncbi:MAG TPA: alpha/beta fold hydrolase [Xanthobacteraceae bacterium]|nr:alpha/beta fold hydrolase [Xanthobacteraceae bacterium]